MTATRSSLLLLAALASGVHADTIIPPGNLATQTWTAAASPYLLTGDVTVPAGSTLTIQAGTVVRVAAGDTAASGFDTARTELIIDGALSVNGSGASPVVFQAQSGAATDTWYGVRADSGNVNCAVSYAQIQNARFGFVSFSTGNVQYQHVTATQCGNGFVVSTGSPALSDITSTGNGTGVNITGAGASLTRAVITGNTTGVLVSGGSAGPVMSNLFIANNTTNGLSYGANALGVVTNCTIVGNGVGVFPTASGLQLFNSIVTGNGTGIYRGTTFIPYEIGRCDVWGNTQDYYNCTPDPNCLSVNPLLASTSDPHLLIGSPCIDAADAAHTVGVDLYGTPRPLDGNGSGTAEPDIGAVEYTCGTAVAIGQHPAPVTVGAGHPATFTVAATGDSLTYQWRRNGVNLVTGRDISGATGATLTIGSPGSYDAGSYDVVVTGTCGSRTSNPAALTVTAPCGSADFNGDGDIGTDLDIEAFFRVLAGGNC